MNVYLRNGVIALIVNAIIFLLGWGCIVPDTVDDQTHLFGLIGDVELVRGNTAVVFGMCSILSTLIMVAGLVEALVEEIYRPCRFSQFSRAEKPRKTPKVSGMRISDPKSPEAEENKAEDPVVPKMD